eukprot:jgi/Mesvir1/14015/Mv21630-RA.2
MVALCGVKQRLRVLACMLYFALTFNPGICSILGTSSRSLLADFGEITTNGSLVLPLTFKVSKMPRALLGSAQLPLGGSIRGQGYYYVVIHIGTPPQRFTVIVDTGSTVTYVPCNTCTKCGTHDDARYDPGASSTSSEVPCGSAECAVAGTCTDNVCRYTRHYAEKSSTTGRVVKDTLDLGGGVGNVEVIFGCEESETGDIYSQDADGIMGLGQGGISIPNQLVAAGATDNVFSMCYGGFNGGGAIVFGSAIPTSAPEPQWTPLLQSSYSYYVVRSTGMAVGGVALPVSDPDFAVGYGTVLDSGTTFSYVPTAVFEPLVQQVRAQIHLPEVEGPDPMYPDICFGNAGTQDQLEQSFPLLTISFYGNVVVQLQPVDYLFQHAVMPNAYCLGFFDNGRQGTLIGGVAVRNKLVIYDRQNRRIGFTPADCDHPEQLFSAPLAPAPMTRPPVSSPPPPSPSPPPPSPPPPSPSPPSPSPPVAPSAPRFQRPAIQLNPVMASSPPPLPSVTATTPPPDVDNASPDDTPDVTPAAPDTSQSEADASPPPPFPPSPDAPTEPSSAEFVYQKYVPPLLAHVPEDCEHKCIVAIHVELLLETDFQAFGGALERFHRKIAQRLNATEEQVRIQLFEELDGKAHVFLSLYPRFPAYYFTDAAAQVRGETLTLESG